MKRFLAIDLGASSGRGIVGEFDGEKINLCEVHRFDSAPALLADGWHWDIAEILRQIKLAMKSAADKYGKDGIDSMGINSWGVDYGLIDKNGALLQLPFHYRDTRTDKYIDEIHKIIPKRELYGINGLQFMNFNTVYQLYAHIHESPYIKDAADCFLMIPQLLGFFLTGKKCIEYTDASTTGLLDAKTRNWSDEIIERLGLPKKIFPEIVQAGTVLGDIKPEIAEETGLDTKLVNVASHDTASAFSAVPSVGLDSIFISSGTWSLMGVLLDEPNLSDGSFEINFTNEGNPERKIRYLRNIMGTWLLQQSRRVWASAGNPMSFPEITEKAVNATPFSAVIDVDYPVFGTMCDMPKEIVKYCEKIGQYVPKTEGEIARCICEGLALKYRDSVEKLEGLTGKKYDAIQIIGGGTQNKLICQMTANACKKKVVTGPVEATAIGNIALQIIASGELQSVKEVGKVVAKSEVLCTYEPKDAEIWDKAYNKLLTLSK